MEIQKTKKEILTEEIQEVMKQIEDARKNKKNSAKLKRKLTDLILQLDNLEKDEEYSVKQ